VLLLFRHAASDIEVAAIQKLFLDNFDADLESKMHRLNSIYNSPGPFGR
jgi:hypothetical protein